MDNENRRPEPEAERSKWATLKLNIKLIYAALRHREIYRPLFFFMLTGFTIPIYEDVQYYFLIDTCKLTQVQYDYLNICQSVGIIVGIVIYSLWLMKTEVWKLVAASLIFNFFETLLQYSNVRRFNL
jgi:hypothetical protein